MVLAHVYRRRLASVLASGLSLAAALAVATTSGAETVELTAKPPVSRQVKIVVDVSGDIKTNPDGKALERLEVGVHSEQHFVERTLPGRGPKTDGAAAPLLLRYYRQADADIKLGKAEMTESLDDDRRHIALQEAGARPTLYSPVGPLSREELELLEGPASLLALEKLLPGKSLAVDATWKAADDTLTQLLCLDVIHQHDIVCKLASVEGNTATVTLGGKAAGACEGVSSDIELIAKYTFDLKTRNVNWLTLALRETRAVGHAQPGFETITKLQLVAAPIATPAELTDKAIAELPLDYQPGDAYLSLRSPSGGYEIMHDRRWRVMVDRHDVAVMRLIDNGDLVAQCNVSKLPKLKAGETLTLDALKRDVGRILTKSAGQIGECSQSTNEQGLQVLRIDVTGSAAELPIQWMYYHVSDSQGNRASIVFTLEAKLVERFAQIDSELVAGFRFLRPDEVEDEPTEPEADIRSAKRGDAALPK